MINRSTRLGITVVVRSNFGFTLIELMVTVVVVAILAMIAVPNFRDFIQRNNVTAQANGLLADLQYARSEAITRRTLVSICPRPTGVSDDNASCVVGGSNNFDNGWLIYKTTTANTIYNGGAGQELLRLTPAARTVSVRASAATILTINARGELVSEAAGHKFAICYKANAGETGVGQSTNTVPGSSLEVASSGRVSVQPLAANAPCE